VDNGIWKPSAVASGGSIKGPEAGGEDFDERTLEVRRAALRSQRERLLSARRAVIVGAGLVGVELAAELNHFMPKLQVELTDGMPFVLPQLAQGARTYAHGFLKKQGVQLNLGTPYQPESLGDNDVVIWCVGAKARAGHLFGAPSLNERGMIRVNRRMQVLRLLGEESNGSADQASEASVSEMEPISNGCIFAVGDAAAVEGVPTAQIIFHGEEMAAVAVANIEAAEGLASPFVDSKTRREIESMPLLCSASLGPGDGIFATQSEMICTGTLAAFQKQMIEETKMGALRGEALSSLLWWPVH